MASTDVRDRDGLEDDVVGRQEDVTQRLTTVLGHDRPGFLVVRVTSAEERNEEARIDEDHL